MLPFDFNYKHYTPAQFYLGVVPFGRHQNPVVSALVAIECRKNIILYNNMNAIVETSRDQCVHDKFPFHFSAGKHYFSKGNHG